MKGKRLAVIIGQCLTVGVLVLHLNVMTASATDTAASESGGYEDIQTESPEAEITIGVSGYVQLPAAVPSDPGGTETPGEEDGDNATVTTVSGRVRTAAPQTGDETHAERFILQFMLAGIIICLIIRPAGEQEMRKTRVTENTRQNRIL